ncbi:MAG: autotransporter-associated N-terminal domain-containing protein, partial [Fusobacterium necrophorum]|nr:autotransporter-associated N-terminal domain-containing protein [Fusobacterium necrophorum]
VLLYVMLGMNAFAQEVNATVATKQEIGLSTDRLSEMLRRIKEENNKKLKGTQLELVQLMEQGDQVVKSPWASWQFGMNYFYNNGTKYKGRGDRSEKYSYEGIFTRSTDVFERNTSLDSVNYSKLTTSSDFRSGTTSLREGILSQYGLVSERKVKEPIASFDVTASINPRNIEKGKIEISEKTIKEPVVPGAVSFEIPSINVVSPTAPEIQSNIAVINIETVPEKTVTPPILPGTVTFNKPEVKIAAVDKPVIESRMPEINIGRVPEKIVSTPTLPKTIDFNPIEPNVELPKNPALPEPPTFAIVLGADCNTGCGSGGGRDRQNQSSNFNLNINIQANQNIQSFLHYTWNEGTGQYSLPKEQAGLAFKMYAETDSNFTLGTTIPRRSYSGWGAPTADGNIGNKYYFNSYNFGDNTEFGYIRNSSSVNDKNHQYFFVGGSRFIESDNAGSSNTIQIPSGYTLNLGGILTLGLVSQGHGTTQLNRGTITDVEEKDDAWIKNMQYNEDTNSDGQKDALKILGPTTDYYIKKNEDGYVGYKVGIALVQEDNIAGGEILNDEDGVIDFRGERSIGLYTYIPNPGNTTFESNRKMTNKGQINLSGKESYGMKLAAKTRNGTTFINEGIINLRKNPDGNAKADNSAAMALMRDESVRLGVSLSKGMAKNRGTISLTDVENSLGMFVNIESDMTNEGKININSNIAENTGNSQPVNVAMRADNQNVEVINETSGAITIDGAYAIGMLANDGAKLTNKGKVATTSLSHGTGIMALKESTLINSGSIDLKGTDNIGVYLKNSKNTNSKLENTSTVKITGDRSSGILVADSSLKYAGNTEITGNNVAGIVVDKTSQVSGEGEEGKVKVGTKTAAAGEVTVGNDKKGSYGIIVQKGGILNLDKTDVIAYVKGQNSAGIYSEGDTTIRKANTYTSEGAINFFANDGKIELSNGGASETGKKSLLFYTKGDNAKIYIDQDMTATIKGGNDPSDRGTAFYYEGTGSNYAQFDKSNIETWRDKIFKKNNQNTLNNLTLNMEEGSRLFVASRVIMSLEDTSSTNISNILGLKELKGSNYKTFMLYNSKLVVTQDVNLNDSADPYNKLEIANSSISNNADIKGTQANQTAIAQENNLKDKGAVTLSNEVGSEIILEGDSSTGIYAKNGKIENKGNIIMVGKNSTGIYALNNTEVLNNGKIVVAGENSTGIFYSDKKDKEVYETKTGLDNSGNITLTSANSVGMYYQPGNIGTNSNIEFKNSGMIDSDDLSNTGMYAKKSVDGKAYKTINDGSIILKDGTDNNPTVAIYTDATNLLENKKIIIIGNKAVGMYGYDAINSDSITVGNSSIAIYSQGGKVETKDKSNIIIGNNNSVGIFLKGNTGELVSSGKYEVGKNSYGIVNRGANNKIEITKGHARLNGNAKFIYSEDITGEIINKAEIKSSGRFGGADNNNYGIYSKGKVTNTGNIIFETGDGNVGILAKDSVASITNSGTIKIGESSSKTERNIAIVSDDGKAKNEGAVVADGNYGIGLYARGTGTIENSNSGSVATNGNETIAAYAADTANINLKNGSTLSVIGEKNVGYYLDKGQNSTIESNAKVTVKGNNSNGIFVNQGKLSYNGKTTVTGNGV